MNIANRHNSHLYQFDIDMSNLNQSQDHGRLDFPNIASRLQVSTIDKLNLHQSLEQPKRHAKDFANDFDIKMIMQNSNNSSIQKLPDLKKMANYLTDSKKHTGQKDAYLMEDDSLYEDYQR